MKKKLFFRGLLGFPLGICVGYIITIAISVVHGNGYYAPCAPALSVQVGSEIGAVVLQALLCGILGTACAIGSVVFEVERWGITKQTILHFLIMSFSMLPIAYISNWMEQSLLGALSYFGVFMGIYIVIWVAQYLIWRVVVRKINRKIREKNECIQKRNPAGN